jgi:tetratricopeptide (TPR) repeat protein
MFRVAMSSLGLLFLTVLMSLASAQPSEEWTQCASQPKASSDPHSGCTSANPSGMETQKNAAAYYSSGNAHLNKKNYDGAIVDYDEAIELDPKYAVVYASRAGLSHLIQHL